MGDLIMSNTPMKDQIIDALKAHSEAVFEVIAAHMAALNGKSEWSMEDNFLTTESIAALAIEVGLPAPVNCFEETTEDHFWIKVAQEYGYEHDLEDEIY